MVGRLLSCWEGLFSWAMLVSGRVVFQQFPGPQPLAQLLSVDFAKIRSVGPWDKTPGGISCSNSDTKKKGVQNKGSLQDPGNPDV